MKLRLTHMVMLTILAVCSAQAKTIYVPDDYTTINAAHAAATDGDEIVVKPGIYNDHISINKRVVLRSTFDGHDWSIVENTIIKSSTQDLPVVQGGGGGIIPTLRGFRVTRDPIPEPTTNPVWAVGISGSLNIENNIIENQLNMDPIKHGNTGGAIRNCLGGTIQNNIIRNNRADYGAALSACSQGVIKNNIFYGNICDGQSIVVNCSSNLINNTFSDNFSAACITSCSGDIINNIIWKNKKGIPIGGSTPPRNCLIQGYTGPGTGNIDADPRFVDPDKGDFRLRPDSPAIDNGLSTAGLTVDFAGKPRGMIWRTQGSHGDGSHTDIGAHEFQPQPVTLWIPGDTPMGISGQKLSVAWALQPAAGQTITLELFKGSTLIRNYGPFTVVGDHSSPDNPATAQVDLASTLVVGSDYVIRGRSSSNIALSYDSAPFRIVRSSGMALTAWSPYR